MHLEVQCVNCVAGGCFRVGMNVFQSIVTFLSLPLAADLSRNLNETPLLFMMTQHVKQDGHMHVCFMCTHVCFML